MVLQKNVCAKLTLQMLGEVDSFLPSLENYSDIQQNPKVLMLRNPAIPPETYDAWQKDHRFGRLTCPTSRHKCWNRKGAIDQASRCDDDSGLICASAMVIQYSSPSDIVSYHKDPVAYERIASFTLDGEGVMTLKRGKTLHQFQLKPGNVVVLEQDDCHSAKHSVVSSSRLGLVLRFVTTHND